MVLAVGVAWSVLGSIYYILEGCGLEGDMEWVLLRRGGGRLSVAVGVAESKW